MADLLCDLAFIDLYIRLDRPDQAFYRPDDQSQDKFSLPVPVKYQVSVDRFMVAVNLKLGDREDGSIEAEGVRCRLARQKMSDDTDWVCARRINAVLPDLDRLGVAPNIVNMMSSVGKRDGLIVICGATGQGKTTTAVALLARYLKTLGGTALTIEDPCEYMLAGRHGESGQCFQVEVKSEDDWGHFLKRSLRWAPRYLLVGEIRTPQAAEQILRAATTGHLVITTVHAGTIEEALLGIVYLAEQAMGHGIHNMLATCLTAIFYQELRFGKPFVRYLVTEENSPGDPVRTLVRENKIGMLSTYIERAAARMQNFGGKKS